MSVAQVFRQRFPHHVHRLVSPAKTINFSSVALMIAATGINAISISKSNPISVTNCDGNSNDDNSDDVLSKIKNMMESDFDWNKEVDRLGQEIGVKVQQAVDTGFPTQISYGFVCGFSSGYCLKKVGKAVSVVFGLGFITLQALSYSGYVNVNHDKMKTDMESAFDLNDDGKLDGDDMTLAKNKIMSILGYNMPAGGGFATGFLGGIRSG